MSITIPMSFLIDSATTMNYNHREINQNIKPTLPKLRWLKDFCTVHINLGRRTGKTNYIQSKVNDKHTLIMVCDYDSKKEYEEKLTGSVTNIFTLFDKNPHFSTNNNIFKDIDLNDIYYVYVDEPKLVFGHQRDLEDFYIMFSQCKSEPTFIMLGE